MSDIEIARLLIRSAVGFVMLCFGIYQMYRPAAWIKYIPRAVKFVMPLQPATIMRIHSLGNLSLGLLLIAGVLQPLSLFAALAWWIFILPFCARIDITEGLRDLAIICSLAALILLQ
jgi:uncharacterized protein YjeT (DUF2065 family)